MALLAVAAFCGTSVTVAAVWKCRRAKLQDHKTMIILDLGFQNRIVAAAPSLAAVALCGAAFTLVVPLCKRSTNAS